MLVSAPPQPLSQPTAGWPWWGLIKECVYSPPAVGVVGGWATDSPRRLQTCQVLNKGWEVLSEEGKVQGSPRVAHEASQDCHRLL